MPVYSFEAISSAGDTRKGVIDADSAKAARAQLRSQALVPLKVEPVSAQSKAAGDTLSGSGIGLRRRVFGATALTIWTRQLAGLVSSGLPLERALTSLSDEAEKAPERELVATLRAEVNGGTSFAKALSQHPREFSDIYVAVIGAGEQSGNLGLVLERMADDLEEQQALKSKLIGAALYPAIVSLVAVVIVLFLVTYVVPQVAHVFAGSKRALPVLTVLMIGLSDFVRSYGWLMLLALVFVALGARLALANPLIHEKFDAAWLNLPIIGKLSRSFNAARFGSTLAMLAAAGVPILKALQAASETLSNRAMRRDAQDALVLVREGAPLASALAQKKRFPGLLAMFARRQTTQHRGAMPRHAICDDPGALADRRHGSGGDADRAGRADADHPTQSAGAVVAACGGSCLIHWQRGLL
jgi:general secretion pathway protein F